jgi:hypothetical protein
VITDLLVGGDGRGAVVGRGNLLLVAYRWFFLRRGVVVIDLDVIVDNEDFLGTIGRGEKREGRSHANLGRIYIVLYRRTAGCVVNTDINTQIAIRLMIAMAVMAQWSSKTCFIIV